MNEDAFLSALHESPSDEVTWLALADWLDEDGQPQRAELVRCVRRLRALPVMRQTKARAALEERVVALLGAGVRPVVPQIENSVGMRFSLIEPGRFRMGSPGGEKGRFENETAHEVELTRPFYLGVFPVTQAQWKKLVGDNPSHFSKQGGRELVKGFTQKQLGDFPVDSVSWEDAQDFLRKLGALPAEKRGGRRYRLPSEAEWEYACRGGVVHKRYHFGDALSADQACWEDSGFERPCPVGSYLPNAFGLYDVHGNVWEWCEDWFDEYEPGPATDPVRLEEGSSDERVSRGGAYFNSFEYLRAAHRGAAEPTDSEVYDGFRAVLVTPEQRP
jgi:uncharacterized protein (TIGR02996 family)